MNINATLIVEMITFLLFVWFVMGVIWPPVIRALEKRRTQIAEGIAAAHQEMDVQLKAAKRELYTEIAGLALKAAGQVVHEELDDDKHHKLVGKLVQSWS